MPIGRCWDTTAGGLGSASQNDVSARQTLRVPVGKMGILGSRMALVILGLRAGDR